MEIIIGKSITDLNDLLLINKNNNNKSSLT